MKIDYSAITSKITSDDVNEFKKKSVRSTKFQKILTYIIAFIIVAIFCTSIINFLSRKEGTASVPYQYTVFFIAMFIIAGIGIAIENKLETKKRIRLQKFVKTNGFMFYETIASVSDYQGIIFSVGYSRRTHDVIRNTNGNDFEIGSHDYVVGSGKNRRYVKNGFIRIKLNRQLPHMVLDSKKNNTNIFGLSLTNLPVSFKKDQVLSLEGDFDSSFTLYAPKEYERDALYVFSPDLMALFIDNVRHYDAEIIDDNLYIYSQAPFNLLDIPSLENIFKIIDLVGKKTVSQTKRYADERTETKNSGIDVVDKSGRRLRMKIPLSLIISTLILIFMIVMNILVNYIPNILNLFFGKI